MFKDKAYVCNLCRKVITYSPEEAGKTISCPFCKSPVALPSKWAARPAAGKRSAKGRVWPFVFVLAALAALGGCAFWLFSGSRAKEAAQTIPVLSALLEEGVTVAPAPARVRGAHLSVAVTDVWYGRPDIHDRSINKTEPTQTPVCCVKLAITNTGKEPAAYTSWREAADLSKILLSEAGGPTNSLVSFGPCCAPAGFQQSAQIAPGENAQDLLLFLCKVKPAADLALTLPCEGLGGKGQISFRIPREMVR